MNVSFFKYLITFLFSFENKFLITAYMLTEFLFKMFRKWLKMFSKQTKQNNTRRNYFYYTEYAMRKIIQRNLFGIRLDSISIIAESAFGQHFSHNFIT